MPNDNNPGVEGLNFSANPDASSNQANPPSGPSAEIIRGRKERSDKGRSRGARASTNATGLPPISQAAFERLYSPELWGKALSAPADAAAALTGRKLWEISDKERDVLGASGSVAAQCFAVSDPKYLALALCLVTILDVYGIRIGLHLAAVRKEREEEEKNKNKQ